MPDLRALADAAAAVAREAAEVVRSRPADLGVEAKTTPTDAVTVVDKEAERAIRAALARLRPGDRIVGEEGGDSTADSEVTWYVDPIDGTVNYLYDLPPYAVSVGAVIDGEPVAGAVIDVPRDELYVGWRGGGATRNGEPIRCTDQPDPALALVATGFGYDARFRAAQAEVVRRVLPRVRDIRRAGSAAIDLCSAASGRVDAFYEAGMHPWDWAAGTVIAREAGARVDGLLGRPPGSHVTLVANPRLWQALHDLLVDSGAGDLAPMA
jgi:myo-inositol-1(or 4)-monophosphatase